MMMTLPPTWRRQLIHAPLLRSPFDKPCLTSGNFTSAKCFQEEEYPGVRKSIVDEISRQFTVQQRETLSQLCGATLR